VPPNEQWPETVIESLTAFLQNVLEPHASVTSPLVRSYVYRGQAVARWPLQPSLCRMCTALGHARPEAIRIEKLLLDQFRERVHLHLEAEYLPTGFGTMLTTSARLEWWGLMQHYRAPTRLLDWTHSPLVALYFAANERWNDDGAVWVVQRKLMNKGGRDQFGPMGNDEEAVWILDDPPPRVIGIDPLRPTERMVAQQGCFTISQDILADHALAMAGQLPAEAEEEGQTLVNRHKYIIPAARKPELLRLLHHMNVTAASLFPGIDGLGAELEEVVRLHGTTAV